MSKQQKAKAEQGYDPKPGFPTCSNCKHYTSDIHVEKHSFGIYRKKNIRCAIGGFKIKKQGTCNKHEEK